MKGRHLGEFEEVVLLSVRALDDRSYSVSIQELLEDEAGRSTSLGAIYAVLDRLQRKGLVSSEIDDSGDGRPKRRYALTDEGVQELEHAREVREKLWEAAG